MLPFFHFSQKGLRVDLFQIKAWARWPIKCSPAGEHAIFSATGIRAFLSKNLKLKISKLVFSSSSPTCSTSWSPKPLPSLRPPPLELCLAYLPYPCRRSWAIFNFRDFGYFFIQKFFGQKCPYSDHRKYHMLAGQQVQALIWDWLGDFRSLFEIESSQTLLWENDYASCPYPKFSHRTLIMGVHELYGLGAPSLRRLSPYNGYTINRILAATNS